MLKIPRLISQECNFYTKIPLPYLSQFIVNMDFVCFSTENGKNMILIRHLQV